jgi:hypothetical protein
VTPKKQNNKIFGFGFDPLQSEHFFLVTVPSSKLKNADVVISEHFYWPDEQLKEEISVSINDTEEQIKVILPRFKWDEIAEEVKAEFNRRLRAFGSKTGKWIKKGQIPIDRTLGKELVLLAWAIEDADPLTIQTAIRNWAGLAPEERWWLYLMTNASTGHVINGRNKGWRKAIRFALTENPVTTGSMKKRKNEFELSLLFGD